MRVVHDASCAFLREVSRSALIRVSSAPALRKAREMGCCKLTLEVLENNRRARQVYEAAGFADPVMDQEVITLHWRDSAALLAEAHRRGINTAIETAGNVPWEFFCRVLEHADTVLHDHKLSDPARHKQWVGVDNARVQANFQRAYETFPDKTFIARTPVIPGVNDDEEHIRAVLAFIRPYKNVVDYELLPYHRFGETKYGFLGRVYSLRDFPSLPAETLRRLQAIIDEAFGREGALPGAVP